MGVDYKSAFEESQALVEQQARQIEALTADNKTFVAFKQEALALRDAHASLEFAKNEAVRQAQQATAQLSDAVSRADAAEKNASGDAELVAAAKALAGSLKSLIGA